MWIKNLNDAFERDGLLFNDFAVFLEMNTQILRIISIKQIKIVIIIYCYFCIKNVF